MKPHITKCRKKSLTIAKIKQTHRIVKHIDDFGSITTLEAMRDIGVTNLHARLYDLKKEGYIITSAVFFLTISILYYNIEINKLI